LGFGIPLQIQDDCFALAHHPAGVFDAAREFAILGA
jgi:hypothetical protein